MTILTLHLSISILVSCHFESSPVATFSIVGSDPDTGELGVAVQTELPKSIVEKSKIEIEKFRGIDA